MEFHYQPGKDEQSVVFRGACPAHITLTIMEINMKALYPERNYIYWIYTGDRGSASVVFTCTCGHNWKTGNVVKVNREDLDQLVEPYGIKFGHIPENMLVPHGKYMDEYNMHVVSKYYMDIGYIPINPRLRANSWVP